MVGRVVQWLVIALGLLSMTVMVARGCGNEGEGTAHVSPEGRAKLGKGPKSALGKKAVAVPPGIKSPFSKGVRAQ